jgi:hypothetical protein
MTETYWCPGPWPWQWGRMCTREVPDDPCSAPACVDAKATLTSARDRFNSTCGLLRTLKAFTDLLKPVLSTPLWILIVIAIIAVFAWLIGGVIGGIVAIAIWVFIALWGISWFLSFVIGKMTESLLISLEQARTDFANALKQVLSQCQEQCRGDISIPDCNLE